MCVTCGNDYQDRLRLRMHYQRGSRACVEAARLLPKLSDEQRREENAKEATAVRENTRKGRKPAYGPPMARAPATAQATQRGGEGTVDVGDP